MRVYFTASVVGKKYYLKGYLKIIQTLEKKGHAVISDHIINVSKDNINSASKNERLEYHRKLEKWINSCDFMVVEASYHSMSVGYEISMALYSGKPVLIVYSTDTPPTLFAYHENERLVCERYDDISELPEIMDDFINYLKDSHGTRFTFYITSEIAAYLDKKSRKEKMPKSVYLRKLIEKDMGGK